jgi:hypothetical protein
VPPRKSSEPEAANLKPKTSEVNTPSEMRVWNTGDALNADIDWNAMPIRPSVWKFLPIFNSWVAAPRVCDLAWCGMSASDIERKGGSSYSQARNLDNICKLLANNNLSTCVGQCELLREILRG